MTNSKHMETRWLYTTSENFTALREAAADTCVIPMGCVEKHGLHLPLGTDTLQASHIVWEASKIEPVCVFPDFIFGDLSENTQHTPAGTISLPLETEMLLLEQLCEQIARNGFKKIIVFNGHGGNRAWLSAFQRKLESKPHDYVFMIVNIHCDVMKRIAKAQAFKGFSEKDKELVMRCKDNPPRDGHAGYSETAYIMAVSPESVKMDRLGIQSGESRGLTDKYRKLGVQIRDYGWHIDFPNWIDSDEPIGCNEQIGQAAMRLEAVRVAHIFKRIKEDEDLLKWHNAMWDTNI